MRRQLATLMFVVLLAACAPAPSTAPRATDFRAAEPAVASFTPEPSASVDSRPELRPRVPPGAILIDDDGSGMHLRARPVDPFTLADAPGYAPISFAHHYVATVLPDRRTIAAILWPGGSSNSGAVLHLIDTVDWVDRALDVKIDTYTSPLRTDDRGNAVYWSQPVSGAPAETTNAVWRLDVGSGLAREIVRLPDGLGARDLQVVGGRVAVFAEPNTDVTINGQRRDAPSVFLVDPAAAKIVATVELPVRAGQYQDVSPANADEPWRQIEPGLGWDLPRSRLFVADAESDKIFVVDLKTGALSGPFEPRPRRSLIDTLWALIGTTAEAKMTSATHQSAVVSPDGKRLYVSGLRSDFAKGQDGKYHEQVLPLDLRVIETSDMTEVTRLPAATSGPWMSSDGTLVYGTNTYDSSVEGYANKLDFQLHVRDSESLREVGTLPFTGDPRLLAFSHGRPVAYATATSIVAGTLARATVVAIDLHAGVAVAKRDMDRHFADLVVIPSP